MKLILILSIILIIALFATSTEAKRTKRTFGSCNCLSKAKTRCNDSHHPSSCQRRYNKRCERRCKHLQKKLPSCNCSTHAIKVCGKDASASARNCRNVELSKCIKRFETKLDVLIEKTKLRSLHSHIKVTKRVPRKPLRRSARRHAIKKCGRGKKNKECRRQVRKEYKLKEKNFRKTSLTSCACETKVSLKHKKGSRRYRKKLRVCRRRCLKKAIKQRAREECSTKTHGKRRCRKQLRRKLKAVHCPPQRRSVHLKRRRHHKVTKRVPRRPLRRSARRYAIKKCGRGRKNRECRRQVRKEYKLKEKNFRKTSLTSCACETKVSLKHKKGSRRYRKKLHVCRRRCLKKAIKQRAREECSTKTHGKRRCRKQLRRKLKAVHCPPHRRTVVHRRIHKVSKKKHFKKQLKRFYNKEARKQCGEDKECKVRVKAEIKHREKEFRRHALSSCQCDGKSCERKCLKKAIKERARTEYPNDKIARREYKRSLTKVHCPPMRR